MQSPSSKKIAFTLRFADKKQHASIKKAASLEFMSMESFIRRAAVREAETVIARDGKAPSK